MKQRTLKSAFAALVASGVLAGCATSVDWGGPLLHYRYNYDSRPVVSEEPIVVPAPTATYSAPAVTYGAPPVAYRESTVTQYPNSGVTYRMYRDPVVTYREPTVVYGYQSQPSPFKDKGE